MTPTKNKKNLVRRIAADIDFFFEKILGVELWDKQREIADKLQKHRRVAVRSCNGAGKTFFIPRFALWFLIAHPQSLVINTAPTWRQIENQYWRYFRDAYNKAKYHIGGQLLKTQFNFREDWFAIGVASNVNNVANFQGWHAKNILVIFDEASGIPKLIWEAVEGVISGGGVARFIAIGNPNTATGDFAECFTSPLYAKIHISAFDLPNVKEKRQVIQGLSTYEWVEEMKLKYGEDSDVYRVRVLGDFPQSEVDTLIPLHYIETAFDSDRERYGEDEKIGLDPARFGDDKSGFVYRKGNYAKVLAELSKFDTMAVTGQAKLFLKDYPKATLWIDITGGLGAGIYDRLREQPDVAARVYGVNVAGKAHDPESFINIRVESWHNVKNWVKDAVLEKHEGFYELAQPKYKINSNGKIQLESKDEMKKRKIKSPNIGDAIALTLSKPTEGENLGVSWI